MGKKRKEFLTKEQLRELQQLERIKLGTLGGLFLSVLITGVVAWTVITIVWEEDLR